MTYSLGKFTIFIILLLWLVVEPEAILGQEDSVKVLLKEDLKETDSVLVRMHIENHKKSTILILTEPFLIEGVSSQEKGLHPWPGQNYTVNTLYYEEFGQKFSFTGDTDIRPLFLTFPKLLIIKPGKSKTIKLVVDKQYRQLFNGGKFSMWCTIAYGTKKEFECLVKKHPSLWNLYSESLVSNKTNYVYARRELDKIEKTETNVQLSKIIWEGIAHRASSSKIITYKKD